MTSKLTRLEQPVRVPTLSRKTDTPSREHVILPTKVVQSGRWTNCNLPRALHSVQRYIEWGTRTNTKRQWVQ